MTMTDANWFTGRRLVIDSIDLLPHLVLPKSQRTKILNLLNLYKVSAVFTGHWHDNNILTYKSTQLITSGPITFSLGEDPSGIRLIEVDGDNLTHEYIEL